MFADDTILIKQGKRVDPLLSQKITCVRDWFSSNKMTVNPENCSGYGKPDTLKSGPPNLLMKHPVGIWKFTWIKLLFREHIDYVVRKLNKYCGHIYRVRHIYPRKCLLLFYFSFAKSVISYALLVSGTTAKTNLQKVECAKRRLMRAVVLKTKIDSRVKVLADHNILNVFEIFLEVIQQLFRQIRKESSLELSLTLLQANQQILGGR